MKLAGDRNTWIEEHCSEPGLPARGDFVIVAETLR